MRFTLTILGSSSALPTSSRFPSAHLLNVNERFYLIDCGEGTQMQLRKFKTRLGKINHVFISHTHGDHVFGLFGLFSTLNLLGRKTELHIYAPGELKPLIDFYTRYFGEKLDFRIILHHLGFKRPNVIFRDNNVEVTSFPLKHRVPTCGFLFRELPVPLNLKKEKLDIYKPGIAEINEIKMGKDLVLYNGMIIPNHELTLPPWKLRSYAFCSDTGFIPSIAGVIKDVDLLYHEATFADSDEDIANETLHSTGTQAAKIAKLSGAKKLLLGHFSSRYKNPGIIVEEARSIFPETFEANDGEIFDIKRCRM